MNLVRFQSLSHYWFAVILLILVSASMVTPSRADTHTVDFEVGCPPNNFPPPKAEAKRKVGDTDIWIFHLVEISPAKLSHIHWNYPTNHTAEEWGTWRVSGDKKTLTWNPPTDGLQAAGVFNVSAGG